MDLRLVSRFSQEDLLPILSVTVCSNSEKESAASNKDDWGYHLYLLDATDSRTQTLPSG